jgi:TfoX C-terminal domain.
MKGIEMAELTTLGFGKTMVKKLQSVGINTAEEFLQIGSKEAIIRLRVEYPSTCVVILYHLQAAIEGVKIRELAPSTKKELKDFFDKL